MVYSGTTTVCSPSLMPTPSEPKTPLESTIEQTKNQMTHILEHIKYEKDEVAMRAKRLDEFVQEKTKLYEECELFLKQLQSLKVQNEGTKESTKSISDS